MDDRIPRITGISRNSQWDFPRRRALFTSDRTYSGSYGNDTSEGHLDWPPEGQNGTDRGTKERQVEDGVEELGFPRKTLERAVTQLKKELDDCRTEFEITRKQTPIRTGNAGSEGVYGRRPKDPVADGARPFHRWTSGSVTPQTFGQLRSKYPDG